jgi:hypothetical protein
MRLGDLDNIKQHHHRIAFMFKMDRHSNICTTIWRGPGIGSEVEGTIVFLDGMNEFIWDVKAMFFFLPLTSSQCADKLF